MTASETNGIAAAKDVPAPPPLKEDDTPSPAASETAKVPDPDPDPPLPPPPPPPPVVPVPAPLKSDQATTTPAASAPPSAAPKPPLFPDTVKVVMVNANHGARFPEDVVTVDAKVGAELIRNGEAFPAPA